MSEEDNITELISAGADITGGAVGGVIGFLLAGPIGAAVGGASGPAVTSVLKRIGLEIKERLISPREEKRIGAIIAYTVEKIKLRLERGAKLRADSFFNLSPAQRSDADEIYEATILAAQREYQENKLKYYGNLVANISFDSACDKAQANHLIRITQELSWRQICILSMAGRVSTFNLRDSNYISNPTMSNAHVFLLDEIMELYNKSLIVFGADFLMGITGIHPAKMRLEGVGEHLYNMMELSTISDKELEDIVILLR